MDNLINFDEEVASAKVENPKMVIATKPLLPSRNSIDVSPDLSSPYEAAEEAAFSGDPYECMKFQSYNNDQSRHLISSER